MPNDAKLGLVVGLGVVIATSVVFFRKDVAAAPQGVTGPRAASVSSTSPVASESSATSARETEGQPTARQNQTRPEQPE